MSFHNLKGYDSHLVLQEVGKFKDWRISAFGQNTEKLVSFSMCRGSCKHGNFREIRFLDSYAFMADSLDNLVQNLKKAGLDKFNHLKKNFGSDDMQFITRKGVYPYEYMNSFDRFAETSLPPKEAFYSTLTEKHISDDDYKFAQSVWDHFKMQTMADYHDHYLKTDTILLADVLNNFREDTLKTHRVEALQFYTSPGMSWGAMMVKTRVVLELLTDVNMYMHFEKLNGGVSMVSKRYAKANNPLILSTYDPSKPHVFIFYFDTNNLYGYTMCNYLPISDFTWVTDLDN